MNNTLKMTVLVCLIASHMPAMAGQTPKGLVTDRRIKIVNYDADNVVHVNTTFGFATTIELAKGEYITDYPGIGQGAGSVICFRSSALRRLAPRIGQEVQNAIVN